MGKRSAVPNLLKKKPLWTPKEDFWRERGRGGRKEVPYE